MKKYAFTFALSLMAACGPAEEHNHAPKAEGIGSFATLMSMTDGGTYHVHLEPSVEHIYSVQAFNLAVEIELAEDQSAPQVDLAVDAFMPLDGHGFLDGPPTVMAT